MQCMRHCVHYKNARKCEQIISSCNFQKNTASITAQTEIRKRYLVSVPFVIG